MARRKTDHLPTSVSEDELAQIRRLHAAGISRNDIARTLGRSGSTVSRVCAVLGLNFDRSRVAAATLARTTDAKARRTDLMHKLIDDAERLRGELFTPTTIHSFGGKDHTYNSRDVSQPLFKDQRDIMGAISMAVNASLRIDDHDADSGAEAGRSMLGALAAGLQVAYDQVQNLEGDDTPVDDADDDVADAG